MGRLMIMLLFHVKPFYVQLTYFMVISLLGFLALKFSKPATLHDSSSSLSDFDVFFTSVSASTVSSMSTLEMEVFSNIQLIIITILMFVGGEVFISMLELAFRMLKYSCSKCQTSTHSQNMQSTRSDHLQSKFNHESKKNSSLKVDLNKVDQIELVLTSDQMDKERSSSISLVPNQAFQLSDESLKYSSIRHLMYAVLLYLSLCHFLGSWFVSFYMIAIPTARQILKDKGIRLSTFSVFTVVSTFANCGFLPTNENMIVFKQNSGLLLLVISYALLGNTLYPPCLRLLIWSLKKVTKREEYNYMLMSDHHKDMDYDHLLSTPRSCLLVATTCGFIAIQFMLLCIMEWNSDNMTGLGFFQKSVASLFQAVNSRHSGESVFDISTISPAIWVLFVLMMYLPPYTTFSPMTLRDHKHNEKEEKGTKRQKGRRNLVVESLLFSQLSYLVIFIILICITERERLREDPLNFNVMNITMEVISAYGNVGLTMGYSCKRRIKADGFCKDSWAGFVGRWSTKGKLILVLVMFFGRLKKFSTNGGKAWKL